MDEAVVITPIAKLLLSSSHCKAEIFYHTLGNNNSVYSVHVQMVTVACVHYYYIVVHSVGYT